MRSTLFFGTRMRCMKCENQNYDCQKCIHGGSQQNLLLINVCFVGPSSQTNQQKTNKKWELQKNETTSG